MSMASAALYGGDAGGVHAPAPRAAQSGALASAARNAVRAGSSSGRVPRGEQHGEALTNPAVGVANGGLDNEAADLILRIGDVLENTELRRR